MLLVVLAVITKSAFMLFKHCFYIFNNVSFYPSLLSFPEIRKLQVPDLLSGLRRAAARQHKM
ncbi:TPA: hypothetical protein MI542_28015 [Klebsiella pneumoniae]|nr:hypothetical protein [Klebsiella pneumoniae]